MKKAIIIAALIFTTGILASCKKEGTVRTAGINTYQNLLNDKKDLASGD
jgi:hypothetical protein